MIRTRYVTIPLDEELVEKWEIGLYVLSAQLAHAGAAYRLDGWPELAHAEREPWGWRLVFAWREQVERV
jgi:hypothetical protein